MKSAPNGKRGGRGGLSLWVLLAVFLALGLPVVLWFSRPGGRGEREAMEVELAVVGHLSPAELWCEAGLPMGMGEPADPELLRERLEQTPVVESVEMRRSGGDGPVKFLVTERKPLARLVCPAVGVGLAESGVPMVVDRRCVAVPVSSYAGMGPVLDSLPLVQVLKIPDFAPGIRLESPALQAAVAVISGAGESGVGTGVGMARQLNDYSITVDFEDGPSVRFGFDDIGGQLQKLRQLQSYAEGVNKKLKTVNLVLRRNIPVTFAEETAEEFFEMDVQP